MLTLLLLPLLAAAQSPVETVTIDLERTVAAPFLGAGVQWDPYEYPPTAAAWRQTTARVDFLRPGFLRVMLNASSYWLGDDEAGKPMYAWDAGRTEDLHRLDSLTAILDYAQSRGIDVMLGEWSPPRGMTPGDARWPRLIADFLRYLTGTRRYTTICWYNLMNEPNGNWMWPGGKVDYEGWAAGVRNLRGELDGRGIKLAMAGPDNSGNWEWLDRSVKEQADRFGAWEMHWYAKDADVLSGAVEKLLAAKRELLAAAGAAETAKPRFIGEAGLIEGKTNGDQQPRVKTFEYGVLMADYFAQVARAGWQGAIAWDMDDAMHAVNGRRRPNPPDELTLKVWGFWNSQGAAMGKPEDEALRPWFYTWSLLSRLFPKGARIVGAEGSGGLRAMAGTANGSLNAAIVNEAAGARTVTVRAPGAGRRTVTVYHYFEGDRPVERDGYPAPAAVMEEADLEGGLTLELPGRGVVFLAAAPAR